MKSDTLKAFRHSGKFNAAGPLFVLVATVALAMPLGLAYAYLLRWIPFIYVNVLATFGYGFLFGWMTKAMLKAAQVRNSGVAIACGLAAGLGGLYGE